MQHKNLTEQIEQTLEKNATTDPIMECCIKNNIKARLSETT